jgi:SAM-dependent methyltransferase
VLGETAEDVSGDSFDWRRLRTSFEEVPQLYDRARPSYPSQVFQDLAELARLPEAARIVEIGCGTGQATIPLAERGYRVTCVELGEQLSAFARRRLSPFPNIEIVNSGFETWQPSQADYDAVVAFTAFHWIDPGLRYPKAASVLRDGGSLAVVATHHVLLDDGDRFFADVQEDYIAFTDESDESPPPHPDRVDDLTAEIDASGCFRNVAARRYVWDLIYTADEYVALLDTYSGHRALVDETRRQLYERIHSRIESRPDHRVRKTYLATLNVAARV